MSRLVDYDRRRSLESFQSEVEDVCCHLFQRDCIKYRFCTVRSRAFDPDYDKGEQQCPRLRPRFTLKAAGEEHHIDGGICAVQGTERLVERVESEV